MNGKSEEVYYSEKPADDIVHHRRDRSGHAALIYFLTINTMSASALSMLSFLCILFYVSFFLLLLLTAAYAFHIFYDKQRSTTLYVLAGCTVVGLLASLFSISTVNVIFQVINGNFSAIWSLSASALNVDTWLIIMMIGQMAAGVLAGYLRFVKKAEELSSEDLSQMQDTAKQVGDAAATAARKAAGSVSEGTAKLSEKWKNYYHTEKGKKTVRGRHRGSGRHRRDHRHQHLVGNANDADRSHQFL